MRQDSRTGKLGTVFCKPSTVKESHNNPRIYSKRHILTPWCNLWTLVLPDQGEILLKVPTAIPFLSLSK